MMTHPRRLFVVLVLLNLVPTTGCVRPIPPSPVDPALGRAARFLTARQSDDGAWRSDTYGAFKDGTALTPLVIRSLQSVPQTAEVQAAQAKGLDYLAQLVAVDDPDLSYPLYTASNAIIVLGRSADPKHRAARDAWVKHLRQRQLTEALGWQPADKEYGGWGYCSVLPRKPKPGQFAPALTESNLSATLFALEALRAAGVTADDPAVRKALIFVRRCQNFSDDPKQRDARFDDGGFFFIYDDPIRNKAGVAGKDGRGRERFHSYGSVTTDGVRALLLCGLNPDDERVKAARQWLTRHFRADSHPGTYREELERNRQGVYFYYTASVARTWRTLEGAGVEVPDGWADTLSKELMSRQKADGSWANPVDAMRENDEVVATCFATLALGACRQAGGNKR